MVKIKSSADIASNYGAAIGRVPAAYSKGIKATTNWQEKASSSDAEELWKSKLQEAMAANRRAAAVSRVSNADWQRKASEVGATRIGPGMRAGADKRTRSFEPFRSAIESVSLPAKTADPMANVDQRVKPIVKAMTDTKEAQLT